MTLFARRHTGGFVGSYALTILLCFACARAGSAGTILEYPRGTGEQPLASPAVPESAFHAWEGAQTEADAVLAAWKEEPVTVPWTRIQLERHIKQKVTPTRGARGLALVHVAMHDAYALAVAHHIEPKLAISMAAAQVLAYLYPAEEQGFARIAFSIAAKMSRAQPESLPASALQALALGQVVGNRAIERAEMDGAQRGWNGIRLQWYGDGRYYGPGAWEPTPPYFYYPPDEPFAPTWQTWVLSSGSEFRPVPPVFGSSGYVKDLREVIEINRALTPEQLKIAKFWVDGSGSVTPPGHWNQIAIEQVKAAHLDDARTAELFALLNVALADTFIAVWDCKYHYWSMRPVTAAKYLLGVELKPAILTPPFPSYPSGHAAFSGAAAQVLGTYFPKQAQHLRAMAQEAATSRMLGGIHFRADNEDGLKLGRRVATKVLAKYHGGA
jgi:hypothetical protein